MQHENRFYWKKHIDTESGLEFFILGYADDNQSEGTKEAWLLPSIGSNLCRFTVSGVPIIDFDKELLLKKDYTGTPVLFPTPNRVRNGVFCYNGMLFNQIKRNKRIFEHGLVYDEEWNYEEPEIRADGVFMNTWIDIDESSPLFEAFPFKLKLTLEFHLSSNSMKVTYTLHNLDEASIPFGFGLHPYFMRLEDSKDTYISLPADSVMDYTSDLLPTGRLIDVEGTIYDLRTPEQIDNLELDHVFTGIKKGVYAKVYYRSLGCEVELKATDDFTHIVLYAVRGENFFCLENQTCSTDAHNMYDRKFINESGLKFVSAGNNHSGSVEYIVKRIE